MDTNVKLATWKKQKMVVSGTLASHASVEQKTTQPPRYKADPSAPSGVVGVSGKPIGYKRKDGYWILSHGGVHTLAHRVVYESHYGPIPEGMVIDHINRDPSDNRIENLRCVTQSVNLANVDVRPHCISGEKYINIDNRTGKFSVRIRRKSFGTFSTLEEAVRVRDANW